MIPALRSLVETWSTRGAETDPEALILGQSDDLARLRSALLHLLGGHQGPACIVIGLADVGEQEAMAQGIARLAVTQDVATVRVDGKWGLWAQGLAEAETDKRLHVVVGWHEKQPDQAVRARLATGAVRIVFLWPLEKAGTDAAPPGAKQFYLDHLGTRQGDAACHMLGQVLAAMAEDQEAEPPFALLDDRILDGLASLVGPGAGLQDHSALLEAGRRIAAFLIRRTALRPNEALEVSELRGAAFPPTALQPLPGMRRLWVEGATDKELFELAARLAAGATTGTNLLEGIDIRSIDGCAQVDAAFRQCRPQKALELFLFDNDADGRNAAEKARGLGFTALTLDQSCVASAWHRDWVLEDLVAVGALDRFYLQSPDLRPIREEISYRHEMPGRRLVVGHDAKLKLVRWLAEHATLDELAGVVAQIQVVRRTYALPTLPDPAVSRPDPRGLRPEPWWFALVGASTATIV